MTMEQQQPLLDDQEISTAFARISLLSKSLHEITARYEAELYVNCWNAQNEGDVKAQIEKAWVFEDRELPAEAARLALMKAGLVIGAIEVQRDAADRIESKGDERMQQAVYSRKLHCSRSAVQDLQPILLKDMYSSRRHAGHYILLRIASRTHVNVNLNIAACDLNGDAIHLRLHNYPIVPHRLPTGIEADAVFPIGALLLIKEPATKRVFDSFDEIICVDSPTDVVLLSADHPLLRGVTWKSDSHPSPTLSIQQRSASARKKDGNAHYKASRYVQAEASYSSDLDQERHKADQCSLPLNRAMCRMKLEKYNGALDDASVAYDLLRSAPEPIPPRHRALLEKALSLKAAAYYKLRRWQEAKEAYVALLNWFPGSSEGAKGVSACDARLHEARTGDYDLVALLRTCQADERIRLDVANYIGPIAVAAGMSAGGSRGLITTRDVKAGEILLATKAIAYSTPRDNTDTSRALDMLTLSHHEKTQVNFRLALIAKLHDQPELLSMISGLSSEADYSGNGMSYDLSGGPREVADPTIDVARLYSIIVSNNFAPQNLGLLALSRPDTTNDVHPSALFLQNSLINHNCLYNCNWTNLNDLQIIRALCPIAAGCPLSISYSVDEVYTLRTNDFRGFGFSCGCSLCLVDAKDGEKNCRTREDIRKEVIAGSLKDRRPNAYSARVIRSAISANKIKLQQIEKSYRPDRQEIRLEAGAQHRYLGQLYGFLAQTTKQVSHHTSACKHFKHSLCALGVQLAQDLDDEHSSPFLTVPRHEQEASLVTMLQLAHSSLCLGDETTAKSWIRGAAWSHDVLYAGGQQLFLERSRSWLSEFGLMDLL